MEEPQQAPNPSPTPTPTPTSSCWSKILQQQSHQENQHHPQTKTPSQIFDCKFTKGISVAVVDANAIIQGGERLTHLADQFVSLSEVINEVRDPTSRHRLSLLPFTIDTMEPSPDSLRKVISFARATGDLQTLSDVDLKLIALTYSLEAQIHGTKHLRDNPPPIHVLNVRRLPEKDMPGWGSNVPNLKEWEELEGLVENVVNSDSRILPLKDLSMNIPAEDGMSLKDGSMGNGGENHTLDEEGVGQSSRRPRKYFAKKREVKIEGKKMVASGIDASQGEYEDDAGDWQPAVSRSTHRRYLRRKSRREMYDALLKDNDQQDGDQSIEDPVAEVTGSQDQPCEENHGLEGFTYESEITGRTDGGENISSILKQMRLEEDSLKALDSEASSCHTEIDDSVINATSDGEELLRGEQEDEAADDDKLDHLENFSQTGESIGASYMDDGDSSEQSWMLRSLSDSSVACVTGDYAMQNVILQMGLRLLAPGGMQIRELHRWILKCHACQKITAEIGRIFCPKCGNGGTLRKVAVTVGENGVVLAAHRPRISLRGTRFSLPLPQGGRDAISKNPILREDQLPDKFLYPKTKKKANKQEDEFFGSGAVFSHHTNKKAPHKPPVRQALAVFSGKRNPNDNHYSRSLHKH
ncbi:hypothetical protein Ancab_014793 [Ancistrocladus abbreviatus]